MELRRYWEIFLRRRKLFYLTVLITLLVAIGVPVLYQYILFGPVYRMPAQVRINKTDVLAKLLSDAPNSLGLFDSDNWFNNIVTLAESDNMFFKVSDRLKLKSYTGKSYNPADFVNGGYLKVITQRHGVTIENLSDTEVIEIGGISGKPEEAASIANTYVDELRKEMIDANKRIGDQAIQFYNRAIPKVKEELSIAEESALVYRAEHHLADVDTYRSQLIAQQATFESNIYIADRALRENVRRKQAILDQMAKQPEFKLSSETYVKNPQIENLKQTLLTAERDLATNLLLYTEDHPTIKSLRKQIDVLQKQLRDQIDKTFSQEIQQRTSYFDNLVQELGDLEIDDVVQTARKDVLTQQKDDLVVRLDELSWQENEYLRLTRLVSVLRTKVSSYLTQLETAKALTQLDVGNVTVLSPAEVPPQKNVLKSFIYFPKKKIIAIIALALSIICGISAIFVVDYADDRIYQLHQLRKALPQSGIIGTVGFNPNHPAQFTSLEILSPPVRQGIQEIANHWKLRASAQPSSVLSIVSAGSREGKSFLTVALGLARAQSGEKVLLIDANVLSPAISTLLNITIPETGMPTNFEQARRQIVSTPVPNLSVLRLSSGGQSMDIQKLSVLLQELKKEYPAILIDTPALHLSRVGAQISLYADKVYLVSRWNQTRVQHIQETNSILQETGVTLTGTVLNGVKQV